MNSKQQKFVLENYSNLGIKKCAEVLNLPVGKIIYFGQKNALKVSKDCISKNASKSTKKRWEENPYDINKYKVNTKLFIENFTIESSYILGLLWADGSFSNRDIRLECIEEDMKHFYNTLEKVGKWNYYTRVRKNSKGENKKPVTLAQTSNRILYQFLKEHDYKEKSIKSPIKILDKLKDDNLIKAFIIGVIDGDGCFYFNKKQGLRQFTISGSLNQDWKPFEDILNVLNIKHTIQRKVTKKIGYSNIRITNRESIKKLGDFIFNEQTLSLILPRKLSVYQNIIL